MKDELDGKKRSEFLGLGAKTQSYSKDDSREDKKARGTKKSVTNTHAQKKLEAFRNNSSDMMIK